MTIVFTLILEQGTMFRTRSRKSATVIAVVGVFAVAKIVAAQTKVRSLSHKVTSFIVRPLNHRQIPRRKVRLTICAAFINLAFRYRKQ